MQALSRRLLPLFKILVIATSVLAALPCAAHSIYSDPPNPVIVNLWGRTWKFSNVTLAGQGNVARVTPGARVSVEFDWDYSVGPNPYCISCYLVFSWGPPGDSHCFAARERETFHSHYIDAFTAPQTAGVYFITWDSRLDSICRGFSHLNEQDRAIAVLIVGQEPWELSQLVNKTAGAVMINTPVTSNATYTNLYALPGLAITMPELGFVTFTPKGHSSLCRSPYWGVEINFQNIQGQQLTWTYYYDVRGEIAATLAADGMPAFTLPRGGQLVPGTGSPKCNP